MMKIVQILLFFVILFFVVSIAYIVYKSVSKKMEKERKINEILIQTEEGRNYIEERRKKIEKTVIKILPFMYILFFIMLFIYIGGTIFIVRYYYEIGIKNITIEDLKYLAYLGMSIYFTIIIYRFIKNNKRNNTKNGV